MIVILNVIRHVYIVLKHLNKYSCCSNNNLLTKNGMFIENDLSQNSYWRFQNPTYDMLSDYTSDFFDYHSF